MRKKGKPSFTPNKDFSPINSEYSPFQAACHLNFDTDNNDV